MQKILAKFYKSGILLVSFYLIVRKEHGSKKIVKVETEVNKRQNSFKINRKKNHSVEVAKR